MRKKSLRVLGVQLFSDASLKERIDRALELTAEGIKMYQPDLVIHGSGEGY